MGAQPARRSRCTPAPGTPPGGGGVRNDRRRGVHRCRVRDGGRLRATKCRPRGARAAALRDHSQDGTVTRIDVATGRAAGPPLPAGPAPRQVVVGASGTLLVRTAAPRGSDAVPESGLTFVARRAGRWIAQPVALEPGAADALIAGDGAAWPPSPTAAATRPLRNPPRAASSRCSI